MAFQQEPEQLTLREREQFNQEKELIEIQAQHTLNLKKLDVRIAELDTKWSNVQKIPLNIIKLPVLILFGIAFIISVIVKKDLPEQFWKYMK